jgi:hypothetical protein
VGSNLFDPEEICRLFTILAIFGRGASLFDFSFVELFDDDALGTDPPTFDGD